MAPLQFGENLEQNTKGIPVKQVLVLSDLAKCNENFKILLLLNKYSRSQHCVQKPGNMGKKLQMLSRNPHSQEGGFQQQTRSHRKLPIREDTNSYVQRWA